MTMTANTAKLISEMILVTNLDSDGINQIIRAIKQKQSLTRLQVKSGFSVGDSVFFISSKGYGKITGQIVKINPKLIRVKSEKFGIWNVTPTMLKLVD